MPLFTTLRSSVTRLPASCTGFSGSLRKRGRGSGSGVPGSPGCTGSRFPEPPWHRQGSRSFMPLFTTLQSCDTATDGVPASGKGATSSCTGFSGSPCKRGRGSGSRVPGPPWHRQGYPTRGSGSQVNSVPAFFTGFFRTPCKRSRFTGIATRGPGSLDLRGDGNATRPPGLVAVRFPFPLLHGVRELRANDTASRSGAVALGRAWIPMLHGV